MSKSLIEHAYEFIAKSKNPVNFKDIWAYVKKEAGLSEEEAHKIIEKQAMDTRQTRREVAETVLKTYNTSK